MSHFRAFFQMYITPQHMTRMTELLIAVAVTAIEMEGSLVISDAFFRGPFSSWAGLEYISASCHLDSKALSFLK